MQSLFVFSTSPKFISSMVIFALVLTAVICLVQLLRTPPFWIHRFNKAVDQCGLHNDEEENPVLISVKRDREKPHGLILKVKNKGLSISDFDKRCDNLKASLNGHIYRIEFDKKTIYTLLFFLPQKYVRPTLIVPTDEAIGSISVKQLINLLVVGPTGTGKTGFLRILLTKIARFEPDAKIWLLDYKQFDFRGFSGLPRYYGFTNCVQGLNDYYEAFKRQQERGIAEEPNYLVIDEWGTFITSLDKKEAELLKSRLAEIICLGRAYAFRPIIGIQRADASYFAGARDNMQCCIALGNLSREGQKMVFPNSVAEQLVTCHKREGHLYIDGVGLEKIKIADIPNFEALDTNIREAMRRPPCEA